MTIDRITGIVLVGFGVKLLFTSKTLNFDY
ncbi:hypothetical protein ACH0B8_05110 [Bacillus altitudinis]